MTRYAALLGELAVPRLVGSASHERVRALLRRELEGRGFVVLEHHFTAAPRFPLRWGSRSAADGVNLIAVRPRSRVTTWLAAHYDSKGQPLSMAARLVWVAATVLAIAAAITAPLFGRPLLLWLLAVLVLGAGFLALNKVTDGSHGAVDNATGVLAVLATLDALPPGAPAGALLLDAEELAMVGARALVRERANLLHGTTVVNFDGIDDHGPAIALVHRPGPLVGRIVTALGSRAWRWLPVMVDGAELVTAGVECVTIMKGNWSTMRVVHTRHDDPSRLTLDSVQTIARSVASALTSAG